MYDRSFIQTELDCLVSLALLNNTCFNTVTSKGLHLEIQTRKYPLEYSDITKESKQSLDALIGECQLEVWKWYYFVYVSETITRTHMSNLVSPLKKGYSRVRKDQKITLWITQIWKTYFVGRVLNLFGLPKRK